MMKGETNMAKFDKEACRTMLKTHYDSLELKPKKRTKADEKLEHAKRVAALCEDIVNSLEPRLQDCIDRDLLEAAAILHDIAKFDPFDEHEEEAINVIRMECGKRSPSPIDPREFTALDEIIRSHKGDFDPHPRFALEAAVLRTADKLDKFSGGTEDEAEKSCDKSLKRIKDYFKASYKALENACRDARFQNFFP